MKKFILIIDGILFLTWLIHFVNKNNRYPSTKDFPPLPKSSQYSIKNKLLFKKYKLPQDSVKFGSEYYTFSDAWATSQYLDSSKSKIRENMIIIILNLSKKNGKSKQALHEIYFNFPEALKINLANVKKDKSIENFGIKDGFLTIYIFKDELIGSLDTLELITNDGIYEKKIFLTSY